MTKIDRVQDLPDWFDLRHYDEAESFSAAEWYGQLAQRQYLITLQEYQPGERFADLATEAFARDIRYIRGICVEKAHIPTFFGEAGLNQYLADEKRSVHPLTFRHLREHACNMEGCHHNPDKWFAAMSQACANEPHTPTTIDPPLFLTDHLPLPDNEARLAAVRVDLDAPDALILESFAAWLAEARALKGQPRDKKFYRPNFGRWMRYGLLPYLDLLIWATETQNHIPDRVMSAAIGGYDAGESNIRKTVAPLAESLMRDLSELRALAAIEVTTKRPTTPETSEH